jgi:hypothetical protein
MQRAEFTTIRSTAAWRSARPASSPANSACRPGWAASQALASERVLEGLLDQDVEMLTQ